MNLLIVDDDIVIVEVIRDSISWETLGFTEVYIAYNIAMAKRVMEKSAIDIAVCDIEMPMGSGLDLLKWAREKNYSTEVIFLTNHESFDFATTALHHQAFSYILKPFNADQLTREVIRAIEKAQEAHRLQEQSQLGSYWIQNKAAVEQHFWRDMLFSSIVSNRSIIEGEIKKRKVNVNATAKVQLVLASAFWGEDTQTAWGEGSRGILEYSIAKMCAELLLDELSLEHVVSYGKDDQICVACIVNQTHSWAVLRDRCRELIQHSTNSLHCQVSCYIGIPVTLDRLSEARKRLDGWDKNNIVERGQVLEGDAQQPDTEAEKEPSIDLSQLHQQLMKGEKIQILTTLREQLERLSKEKKLNATSLRSIQQNIMQAVYVHLDSKGVRPNALFGDQVSYQLMQKAVDSVYDMIKWQSYFINKALDYARELQNGQPVVEQAKSFVCANYRENITRSEVAEHLFLTPEYFAKLFKREEGLSIKEYINRYRIEQAKLLLQSDDCSISDVAVKVGFDNISYFSTLFKKQTGYTPNEFKMNTRRE